MIVTLAARRSARAQELLIEAQVLAGERGQHDIVWLVRSACALLTTPPDKPSGNGTRHQGAKGTKKAA